MLLNNIFITIIGRHQSYDLLSPASRSSVADLQTGNNSEDQFKERESVLDPKYLLDRRDSLSDIDLPSLRSSTMPRAKFKLTTFSTSPLPKKSDQSKTPPDSQSSSSKSNTSGADGKSEKNADGKSEKNTDGSSEKTVDGSSEKNADGKSEKCADGKSEKTADGSSEKTVDDKSENNSSPLREKRKEVLPSFTRIASVSHSTGL